MRETESPWCAVSVDEPAGVSKAAVLVFRDVVFRRMCVRPCALLLPTNTAAAEPFRSLNDCVPGKLNWSFCVGVYTGGAAAKTGRLGSERSLLSVSAHGVIRREVLAS